MKVRDAVFGRSLKPSTACCAATRTLVVLLLRSRPRLSIVKILEDSDNGSAPSTGVTVAAGREHALKTVHSNALALLTIVNDHTWYTCGLLDSFEQLND